MSSAIEVLKNEINEYECVLALDTVDYAKVTNKDKKVILELIDSHKKALLALEQKEVVEWLDAIIFNIQDLRYEGDDELIIKDLKKVKKKKGSD